MSAIQPSQVCKADRSKASAGKRKHAADVVTTAADVLASLAEPSAELETGDQRFAHLAEAISVASGRALAGDLAGATSMARCILITIFAALTPQEAAIEHDAACRLNLGLSVPATPTVQLLVAASNVLRLTSRPWHSSVLRTINLIADIDGYPHGAPEMKNGYLTGRLVDELEWRPIPSAVYEIENDDGDADEVTGPRADARGLVSVEAIRAFTSTSKARMQRARERLTPARRRVIEERGGVWTFPCGLAGYQPETGRVDVRAFLAARRSGRAFADDAVTDPEFPDPEDGGAA